MTLLTIIFWLSVTGIIYPYIIYPFLLRFLVAVRGSRPVNYPNITPSVSLLIPAYNEDNIIGEKVSTSLNLDYPRDKLEVIVISDGSTDRTDEILAGFNDQRLTIIRQREKKGKNQALNRAMGIAVGEIIVFTDANAIFAPNALAELVCPFGDPRIGCVVGKLHYENPQKSLIGNLENLYWSFDNLLKTWEGRLHALIGANGPIFAIRRCLWEEVDDTVHEDFIIPIRIMQKGFYNVYRSSALAREESTSTVRQEFRRRTRIVWKGWVAIVCVLRGLIQPFRGLLIFEILSRKAIKRLIWLFVSLLFLSNIFLIETSFYCYSFIAQIAFSAMALVGRLQRNKPNKNKICYYAYSILILIAANMVGFFDFIRGKKPQGVWEIQRP